MQRFNRGSGYKDFVPRALIALGFAIAVTLTLLMTVTFCQRMLEGSRGLLSDGTVLGGDFLAFYVGGRVLAEHGPNRLYDLDLQQRYRAEVLGVSEGDVSIDVPNLPFVYPPLVAFSFSFISQLSFEYAFTLWTGVVLVFSVILYFRFLRKAIGLRRKESILGVIGLLGFGPFLFYTIFGGQLAWLGMSMILVLYECLRKERDFIAGFILGLSYYKPPLFAVLVVVLLVSGSARLRAGFGLAAFLLVGATILISGTGGLLEYVQFVSRYRYGEDFGAGVGLPPDQGKGLYAAVNYLMPGAYVGTSLMLSALVLGTVLLIRSKPVQRASHEFNLWFALVIAFSMLTSLQVIKYDLLVLAPLLALHVPLARRFEKGGKFVLLALSTLLYLEWLFVAGRPAPQFLWSLPLLTFLVGLYCWALFRVSRDPSSREIGENG